MQKQERTKEKTALKIGTELLKGGGAAAGLAVLFLLGCAALISAGAVEERYATACVYTACALGSVFGGWYSVRRLNTRPVPVGLAAGTILLLLLISAGFLSCGRICFQKNSVGVAAICLIGGVIPGAFYGNSRKKRRK